MKIKINCAGCAMTYDVNRDTEAPKNAVSMGCNWCPSCEDTAEDYYEEWYNTNDGDDNDGDVETDDPNQLMLFSITDDIINEPKKENLKTKHHELV